MIRNIIVLLLVGIAFLAIFLPYIAYKTIETRCNRLTEGQIVSRLGGMALNHLFGDQQ